MIKTKIEDIAKEANVSITAVSFALNNKPGVSGDTARKIIQIARDLDYPIPEQSVDNTIVQVVKIVKHGNILNDELHPFIMSYIEGMEIECTKQRSRMEIISHHKKPLHEIQQKMIQSEASGFIVIATELEKNDILAFSSIQRPLCFVDANYNFMPFSFVDIDNINSVGVLMQHFYDMGHRDIGMISSSTPTPNFDEREKAFKLTLSELGLLYNPHFCMKISPLLNLGSTECLAHITCMEQKPSAFFCVNDSIAYSVMSALKEAGVSIPDDISIIGFDDLHFSKITAPPLTTVHISNTQIGMRAVQLLTQRMKIGTASMPERINICGTLVERNSVKKIAGII